MATYFSKLLQYCITFLYLICASVQCKKRKAGLIIDVAGTYRYMNCP